MFGKFENIESFLDSYQKEQERIRMKEINSLSMENQLAVLRNLQITGLAEVKAVIKERQADDKSTPRHYQLIITLDEILQFTPDIKKDILQSKKSRSPVFVAIRYGDRKGITQPIKGKMNSGDKMHLKGQWITKEKAYSHGGVKMPVLHFTHHPVGFACTIERCYA